MNENIKENKVKSLGIFFLEVILVILILIGIVMLSKNIYISTGNLLFYLIYIHLISVNGFWLVSLVIPYFINEMFVKKIRNKFLVYLFGLLLFWTCMDLMNANVYRFLNKKSNTNIISYKCQILEDAIKCNTTNIESNFNNVVSSKTTVNGARRKSIFFWPGYISFYDSNEKEIYMEAYDELIEIVDRLKKINARVYIEYYNNSGIIKSIEGIDIFDYDKLNKRVEELENQHQEEIKEIKKEQEQEQKQKEQEEKAKSDLETVIYRIKINSVGKNIEDVKEELEQFGCTDYTIKYVSTKFYTIGTVAFIERINGKIGAFYVVENNDKEDLVKMPVLNNNMSKTDVIKILQQNDLKCLSYSNEEYEIDDDSDNFVIYLCAPPGEGEYVPKNAVVKCEFKEKS